MRRLHSSLVPAIHLKSSSVLLGCVVNNNGGRVVGQQYRHHGAELYQGTAKLGTSKELAKNIKERRLHDNAQIAEALSETMHLEAIDYRKRDDPWEAVPRYAKRRVVDMAGVLSSEHRMEMEEILDNMRPICDVDPWLVVVPTVGYVTPRVFANSLFFDWGIGEPRGNGLLILVAQHEGSVQLVTSPGIEEYFHQRFIELLVKEVLQPYIQQGKPSYGILQMTYGVARQAQEFRPYWQVGLLDLPTRNKVRFGRNVMLHGVLNTWSFYWSIIMSLLTISLWNHILDMICPECHAWMSTVSSDEGIYANLDKGQQLEFVHGCAEYKVFRCQKCRKGKRIVLVARDYHHNSKCLKCEDCKYHTVIMNSSIEQLPTKEKDGLKKIFYLCEHCRMGKEVFLPLFRPLDAKPANEVWYNMFLERARNPHQPDDKRQKPVL